jgi:hypothetical protein
MGIFGISKVHRYVRTHCFTPLCKAQYPCFERRGTIPVISMKESHRTAVVGQKARFIEAAKKAESDMSGKAFEKAFKKIVKAEKPKKP